VETAELIPVKFSASEVAARLHFDPARAGFETLDGLFALAEGLIRPRAVFEVAYVGARGEGTIEVTGITFTSPVLVSYWRG
jgi:hypothetical protein